MNWFLTGRRFLFLCLLWLIIPAYGGPTESVQTRITVAVILSSDAKEYHAVFTSLNEQLTALAGRKITLLSYTSDNYLIQHAQSGIRADLIVTIGTDAAKMLATTEDTTPVISVFLPKENYDTIWRNSNKTVSGIVLDQPIERFYQLLSIILDSGDKVGVFSGNDRIAYGKIRRLLKQSGLSLVVENVRASVTARNVTRLLNASDLVLVLPERKILSPQRSKWLLYMAYRENKPVIAYSSSFVKAGAMAAIYSTPESIGLQLAQRIMDISRSSQSVAETVSSLRDIYYPKYFTVETNRQIAMNLGIHLPEDKHLEKEIKSNIRAKWKGVRHAD